MSTPTADRVVIAVDAGGSTTRSALVRIDGTCLGVGFAGAANPVSSGIQGAVDAVLASIATPMAASGVAPGTVVAVVVAAAGGGHRPEVTQALAEGLAAKGVTAPVSLLADGLAAFHSHSHVDAGYVLVAGTGAVALRIEDGRGVRIADGLGWLLGDVGSGFWVGRRVVSAVLADLDGRDTPTALTPLLLEALGLDSTDLAIDAGGRPSVIRRLEMMFYAERPTLLARFARLVFEAPGDAVADGILDEAADALARALLAVMVPGLPGPVAVAGGLLAGGPVLRERVATALAARGINCPLDPVPDGLVGSAVLALRQEGVLVDAEVFSVLAATVAERRTQASPRS